MVDSKKEAHELKTTRHSSCIPYGSRFYLDSSRGNVIFTHGTTPSKCCRKMHTRLGFVSATLAPLKGYGPWNDKRWQQPHNTPSIKPT